MDNEGRKGGPSHSRRRLGWLVSAGRVHRGVGKPIKVTGVGCSESASKVRLRNWSIGGQALPSIVATSSVIAGANGKAFGLLGSDVVSHFGAIGLDYAHGELTLG